MNSTSQSTTMSGGYMGGARILLVGPILYDVWALCRGRILKKAVFLSCLFYPVAPIEWCITAIQKRWWTRWRTIFFATEAAFHCGETRYWSHHHWRRYRIRVAYITTHRERRTHRSCFMFIKFSKIFCALYFSFNMFYYIKYLKNIRKNIMSARHQDA